MGENTTIEWTDHTFNPWIGCTKASDGCANCYAEREDKRRSWTPDGWGKGKPRKRTSLANWKKMLRWDQDALADGRRRSVFCASLADIFDDEVPTSWRDDFWNLVAGTPNLLKLILTKRTENMKAMIPKTVWDKPFDHVAFGTSTENRHAADQRLGDLLEVPAALRFVSVEPCLGLIDFTKVDVSRWETITILDVLRGKMDDTELGQGVAIDDKVHWIIVGGESGPKARPMHPRWARAIRDQCIAAGVPFFFKQWGEWCPSYSGPDAPTGRKIIMGSNGHVREHGAESLYDDDVIMVRAGKKAAGRKLDGRTWSEVPSMKPI